jgi:hypothetical protein
MDRPFQKVCPLLAGRTTISLQSPALLRQRRSVAAVPSQPRRAVVAVSNACAKRGQHFPKSSTMGVLICGDSCLNGKFHYKCLEAPTKSTNWFGIELFRRC